MNGTGATTDFGRWWAEVLTLRRTGEDRFEAQPSPAAFGRMYGGQLAAQSLLAAASTVSDGLDPNAVHTVFLRGGDVTRPVTYQVERARQSRSLSTRLVRAVQGDRLLATATASFHRPPAEMSRPLEHETGTFGWPGPSPGGSRPAAPDPESLPSRPERLARRFGEDVPPGAAPVWPADVRYVDRAPWDRAENGAPTAAYNRLWMRAGGQLPDVPAAHAAALTFASDYPMFEPVLYPHSIDWTELISGRSVYGASLDHALWFHRLPRFDEWLLLEQVSPVAARCRGFSRAEARAADGRLVATVAQEVAFTEPRS
jgi:acyl-CoA thioesterase II